jgi:nitric oxide reductase NorQ protein
MKRTMAVFSLVRPAVQGWRYDIIAAPDSQQCFCRLITPASNRPRWKTEDLDTLISSSDQIATGPALIEVSDQEAAEMVFSGRLPRNIQLRAESVRQHLAAHPEPAVKEIGEWLTIWRSAIANMEEAWLRLNTSKHGKPRTNATKAAKPAATAVIAPSKNAVRISSAGYEPVVKGRVKRPSGEMYRCRKIGRQMDVMVLRSMREHRMNILLTGPSGTGKTALVEAAFGSELLTINGSEDTESGDFLGGYAESESGDGWLWADGPLLECMERGWPLYVDEIGIIRTRQLSVLYSVMDGRDSLNVTMNPKRGTVRAAPGFMVISSANPDLPESRMSDALISRFGFHLEVNSDYKMARDLGVPDWLCGASENLEIRRVNSETNWAPQLRDLIGYMKNVEILRDETAALGVMINSAPKTVRPVVSEVLSKACGRKTRALMLT